MAGYNFETSKAGPADRFSLSSGQSMPADVGARILLKKHSAMLADKWEKPFSDVCSYESMLA
jgi:hypothetical protein